MEATDVWLWPFLIRAPAVSRSAIGAHAVCEGRWAGYWTSNNCVCKARITCRTNDRPSFSGSMVQHVNWAPQRLRPALLESCASVGRDVIRYRDRGRVHPDTYIHSHRNGARTESCNKQGTQDQLHTSTDRHESHRTSISDLAAICSGTIDVLDR